MQYKCTLILVEERGAADDLAADQGTHLLRQVHQEDDQTQGTSFI